MLTEGDSGSESPSGKRRIRLKWWQSSSLKIYVGHSLSSWGDRMWQFAVGLYMVILFPQSLLLTAIFGFSNCLSGIIFGPYIGEWIDKTQRITAARCALLIQNAAVVLGATFLALTLHFRWDIKSIWDGKLEYILYAVIILIALVADLASVASKIALEKDWIVVLAGGCRKKLSRLNATMRTINLTTYILAPFVIGQIIHFGSQVAGAAFIAGWNFLSALVEYNLLLQIYKVVPELGMKNSQNDEIPFVKISSPESDSTSSPRTTNEFQDNNNKTPEMMMSSKNNEYKELQRKSNPGLSALENNNRLFLTPGPDFEDISLVTPVSCKKATFSNGNLKGPLQLSSSSPIENHHTDNNQYQHHDEENGMKGKAKQLRCVVLKGCKSYFSHHVKFAGLGLSCLYMTVLGFDSITTGFIYSQGVNESLIGILTAIGALFGILGSLSFPFLRRKFGKSKTGILGFSFETLCLLLCVGSIFALGSPFKPQAVFERFENFSGIDLSSNSTHLTQSFMEVWNTETHVIFLMAGIIIARYGVWVADLTVTQIFQEEVEESQRGIINGVQDSLNKLMDLLKFALVILLPSPETFGFHIIISWLFVFIGTSSFIIYTRKENHRLKTVLDSSSLCVVTNNQEGQRTLNINSLTVSDYSEDSHTVESNPIGGIAPNSN